MWSVFQLSPSLKLNLLNSHKNWEPACALTILSKCIIMKEPNLAAGNKSDDRNVFTE